MTKRIIVEVHPDHPHGMVKPIIETDRKRSRHTSKGGRWTLYFFPAHRTGLLTDGVQLSRSKRNSISATKKDCKQHARSKRNEEAIRIATRMINFQGWHYGHDGDIETEYKNGIYLQGCIGNTNSVLPTLAYHLLKCTRASYTCTISHTQIHSKAPTVEIAL